MQCFSGFELKSRWVPLSNSYELKGAVFLEVALSVATQRQTPCVTNSRTTAKKTTILQHTGNKKNL